MQRAFHVFQQILNSIKTINGFQEEGWCQRPRKLRFTFQELRRLNQHFLLLCNMSAIGLAR